MNTRLLGLLAETPVHVGAGQSTGYLDLPVAREAATDYPVVPGSGVKGALRDAARSRGWDAAQIDAVFGRAESSGALVAADARLLLLPIRSLHGTYRWVTCPHLLERLGRDLARAGARSGGLPSDVPIGSYLGSGPPVLGLEERQFRRAGDVPTPVVEAIRPLVLHETTARRLQTQLVLLHDEDFAWFARYGLAVSARNQLDSDTKTSRNLWYEESVPPDALFTLLLAERGTGVLDRVCSLFEEVPYLQVGGNETVGHGILAVKLHLEGTPA